ncbi:MAG: hypothetical protein NTW32_19885 [Chloroflexi bacterium]|nr:hypothetical protein [Chloroflexota bacterium]
MNDITPLSFWHTVATRLVRNPTVDLATAAAFLGHTAVWILILSGIL